TSYLVGNTWVGSAPSGTLPVRLVAVDATIDLPVSSPRVAVQLDAQHRHATSGTISGVIAIDALLAAAKIMVGSPDVTLCSGPTPESILTQLEQAADILVDGTQDPTKECDGVSIGLGFEAERVKLGPIGPEEPPSPDPCP